MVTDYNWWANNRLISFLLKQDEEVLSERVESSFPSIIATALHVWDAETLWYQRLHGNSLSFFPSQDFTGTAGEALEGWLTQSLQLKEDVQQFENDFFMQHLSYQTTKGLDFSQPAGELILHVTHHSAYHRGQIITMCRQLKLFPLPSTDLIVYLRQNGQTKE